MRAQALKSASARPALLEVSELRVDTPTGRPLFRQLTLSLEREQVALIGRNGVGKSTLLHILAGNRAPDGGSVVHRVAPLLVSQDTDDEQMADIVHRLCEREQGDRLVGRQLARERSAAGLPPFSQLAGRAHFSRGEARKLRLLDALLAQPELLLLDEPTQDLDQRGVDWLARRLCRWRQGLLVVSHDRRLLQQFRHFFVVAESGCRYLPGSLHELEQFLERADADRQRQYARNLEKLARAEQHHETLCRRRQRKKNVGRLHELRRATSRARLNEKRSYAQESQARAARIRANRIAAVRGWAHATRRALAVQLPLELLVPDLGPNDATDIIALQEVSAKVAGRELFAGLDVCIGRERLAVTGPNGAGKTTLLGLMLGRLSTTSGVARRRRRRIGAIAQGAGDWMSENSLLSHLSDIDPHASPEDLARLLVGHRFPLALAERPLRSLSPGERVRAALICLFRQTPAIDMLVLDEPTYSLDFVGASALRRVLAAWPGGLVVASHDREFLQAVGIERSLELDGRGGWSLQAMAASPNDSPLS